MALRRVRRKLPNRNDLRIVEGVSLKEALKIKAAVKKAVKKHVVKVEATDEAINVTDN